MADQAPSTVTMYDANGTAVSVPASEVPQALQTGNLGFKENQQVFVQKDSTSPLVPMRGADVVRMYSGYDPANATNAFGGADAYQDQQDRAKYGGVAGTVGTAAQGAFSGVTFGLGDAVTAGVGDAIGYGDEARDFIEKGSRINPNARLAGEVVGALAPALVTAGTSSGASAAGMAARGATALGRAGIAAGTAVEGAAARGLARTGLAALTEGSIASRAISTAAGQAAEGALYGIGDAVSRSVVKNENLTAEHLLSGGLLGAAFGAAGGAAVGGGMAAAGKAGRGLLGAAEHMAGITGVGEKAVSQRVAGLAEKLSSGTSTGKSLQELAGEFAGRTTLQATGAAESTVKRLLDQGDSVVQRAEKQLLTDIPGHAGSRSIGTVSPTRMAEAAEKNVAQKSSAVSSLLSEVDALGEAGAKAALLEPASMGKHLDAVASKLDDLGGHAAQVSAVSKASDAIKALSPEASLGDLAKAVDGLRTLPTAGISPEARALVERAKSGLDDALISTAQKRVEGAGAAELAAKFTAALDDLKASRWVSEAAAEGSKRGEISVGIGDVVQALSSATHAAAAGNPMLLAGLAGGAALAQAKRTMGQQIAADIAQRAVKSDAIQALSAMMDGRLRSEVGGFFTKAAQKASTVAGAVKRGAPIEARRVSERREDAKAVNKRRESEYQSAVAQVRALQAAPQKATEATAGLSAISPTLATKAAASTQKAAAFLASKVPKTTSARGASLTPHLDAKKLPSRDEMQRFMSYHRTVTDPASALVDLRKGRLTSEQVEALRVVYPETYAAIQETVRSHLAELRTELPYSKQLALGTLLGVAVAPSQDPAFIAMAQQAIAGGGQGQEPQGLVPGKALSRPLKVADRMSLDRSGG